MLIREKVIAALEEKRDHFAHYQSARRRQLAQVEDRLDLFLAHSSTEILARVDEQQVAWPGALPTAEFDQAERLRLPFPETWESQTAARAWALAVLRNRPVAAVDGSQITPNKDLSLPVGAIQVGWYVNYHEAGGRYEKDLAFTVLAPDELVDSADAGDGDYPDWKVNQLRFVAECARLCGLMEEFAGRPFDQRPLCFFDGSLIISFAGQLRPERAAPYLKAVRDLLATSERCQVPLVGYVDSSQSRDVTTLFNVVVGPPYLADLTDGALLRELLPNWGDRSPLFVCARQDILSTSDRADFYRQVAFTYLHLAADRPPARIEMPLWLVEAGRAPEVIDLVRAECVVGAGYPYAVETADAVAVIQQADRERFYALLQQFAEREQLPFVQSRKAASKQSRRG